MKIFITIVQILVALVFLAAGSMKLVTTYDQLAATEGMAWVGDLSSMQIKIISVLEVLGALGLILPLFLKKYRVFVPTAAIGLAAIMIGAIVTHVGRGEPYYINLVLLALTALIVWLRKGYFKKASNS